MTKRSKIILILSISIILCASAILLFLFFHKQNDSNITNTYEFVKNEENMYMSDVVGWSGDFLYFQDYPTSYNGEYDILKDKAIKLPNVGIMADYNFYNGDLYCIRAGFDNDLSIVKWNVNTGDYETIYTPPDGVEGLYNFSMTTDGLMFFLERRPSSEVEVGTFIQDDDGYNINYTLYIYNPETKEKTPLVEGVDKYYVSGNRLYFDKVHYYKQTEEVFYIDFDKPEEVIDTGICCRTKEAVQKSYDGWFSVDKDYIYYSGGTENYYRRSIKSGKDELLFTYSDSEGYIVRGFEFNGKHILYIRCAIESPVDFGAKLFELDTETKEYKNVWTDTMEELLGDCTSFKGNNDFYYLSTYPSYELEGEKIGFRYYMVYSDGKKKLIYDNVSEWLG